MSRRYLLLILLSLILSFRLEAQPAEVTYFASIAKNGSDDNAIYGPFNIGFSFTFFGNSYSQFFINTNGQITFGAGTDYPENYTIPDATLMDINGFLIPNNYIAPFWDDLTIDASGNILYTTIGASPNRKLIVQFRNMGFYGGPVYMGTFFVILHETSGVIQTQYRILVLESSTRAHGASATIGLENSGGTAGTLYSFNNPTAITSRQAISFTPSGGNYAINSAAVYDGVYLTRNLTLPEPGITPLVSPAENGTINTSHTFQWAASSNAASYSLKISTNSSLSGAVSYNAGSNLSYDISGLIPGTIYYWGVFATNATGTTWSEVKKFNVSNTPPLAAVAQTIWTEQGLDKTIKLNYTGGDASPKTAIITSLPLQGKLYQYNAGTKGAEITATPITVSDAGMNVIYEATGTSGNGVGNFNYKVNDAGGDSPVATITVNVSPPGVPNLLYSAKSTTIELQFDRPMADPAGKQLEFAATVNGSSRTISSLSLKTGDNYSIIATLSPALTGSETVLISYTTGTIASAEGGWLATFINQSVTLTAQTITFTQSLTKKYSDSPVTFTATAPGGSMTYSSSNQTITTVSGSVATLKAIGSVDITARQAGNATYAPAKYTRTMTVARGDQTITFTALPVKTYGDSDFTLSAVAGSSLLVSFVSSNLAVATVSGNSVHIVGQGTTTITASQSGNTLWNPATDVPQNLTVNKANQTITFTSLQTKTYGDSDFTLSAVAGSSLLVSFVSSNLAVATVTENTVHITGAGVTTITASQSGNANYNPAPDVPQTLTVIKKSLTVTATGPAKEYGTALTAGTSTTNFTAGTTGVGSEIVTSVTLTPDAAGLSTTTSAGAAYVVTPSLATGSGGFLESNYNITYIPYNGTVSKKTITATADNKTKIYGEVVPPLTITYTGFAGTDTEADIDTPPVVATTGLQNSDAGAYTITVSGGSDTNYTLSYADGTLTIGKADQTIIFTSLPVKTYGDSDFILSAVAGSSLLVGFVSSNLAVATVTGNTVHIVGAGVTTITASQGGSTNYNAAPDVPQMLTVNKADQTISFDPLLDKTYGNPDFPLSAVAGSSLLVDFSSSNPAVATVTGNVVHIAGVGTTTITASQAGDGNYNAAPDVQQTLNVYTANATVTLGNLITTYNGLPQAVNATTSPAGLNVDITYDGSATLPVNAGTYIVDASINDGSYHGSATGTMIINKADQTIMFNGLPIKTYGDSDFTLSAVSGSGFLVAFVSGNPAVATVTGNSVHIVGVGSATITASQSGDANYNPAPDVLQTLNVYTANATVTLGNLTTTYNGLPQAVTATTSPSGLNVDITYDGSATLPVNAGTYTVDASINDGSYHGSATGMLVINKADQTISFISLPDKTYGGSDFTLSAGAGSLLLVSFVSGNTSVVTVAGNTVHIVGAGVTTITASQGGSTNYNSAPDVSQILTVNKAAQTIEITQSPEKLLVGDEFILEATSTSGLTVLFESMDNTLATVNGNVVKGVSKGNVQIRAYHAGNQNYNAAEKYVSTEVYSTHKDIMHLFTPNNDGFNDYWELPDLATWGKCDVKVFSRSGKLIFSDPDYNNLWDGISNGNPVPEGAYYFIIKTENAGVIKGTLNLVR